MSLNLGNYPSSAPEHPLHMSCVYAISGTYGFLPRLLYYVTLVFAIFGRSREWLIIGALVSALTYAGTTAIHQITLLRSRRQVFDLDIIGAWAILSTGALAYIAMMHWSSTLRTSRARTVIVAWGVLIGVALIFGRVEMFDTPMSDPEPACYSSTGRLLEYPVELISPQFNCTYKCFSVPKPMRQSSEVMAVPSEVLKNKWTRLSVALVGPIQFAAYAALSWDRTQHTPSQLCTRFVIGKINPKHKEDIVKLIYNASSERWYGGYFVLFRYIRRSKWTRQKAMLAFVALPWFILELLIDILAIPMMVANIVLNELSLMRPDLPTNEANYAIGQWGPIVGSVLVVFAALFNKYMELQEQAKKNARELQDDAATIVGSPELRSSQATEMGDVEEQTIGIVKPKLAHVETLRDMDELIDRPK